MRLLERRTRPNRAPADVVKMGLTLVEKANGQLHSWIIMYADSILLTTIALAKVLTANNLVSGRTSDLNISVHPRFN